MISVKVFQYIWKRDIFRVLPQLEDLYLWKGFMTSFIPSTLQILAGGKIYYIEKQINYYINCVGCSNVVCSHLYLLCYLNGHIHANIIVIANYFPAKLWKECWWIFFHQHKHPSASGKMLFKKYLEGIIVSIGVTHEGWRTSFLLILFHIHPIYNIDTSQLNRHVKLSNISMHYRFAHTSLSIKAIGDHNYY